MGDWHGSAESSDAVLNVALPVEDAFDEGESLASVKDTELAMPATKATPQSLTASARSYVSASVDLGSASASCSDAIGGIRTRAEAAKEVGA